MQANRYHHLGRHHGSELFEAAFGYQTFGLQAHEGFAIGAMAEGAGGYVCRGETMVLPAGAAHLLWLAWRLLRDDGRVAWRDPAGQAAPGCWSGALMQGLNPKAWLAALSSLSTFVMPLADPAAGLAGFTANCWISLAAWALGAGQGSDRAGCGGSTAAWP